MPLARLAFPSLVAASQDDPFVPIGRARDFAQAWGSRFVDLGLAGHVNVDSGHGPWAEGLGLLEELAIATAVERA
jgi:predicted alpha/beta hydrolase family esterase